MPTHNPQLTIDARIRCSEAADTIGKLHVDQWAEWICRISEELESRLPEQEADQFAFDVISRHQDRLHHRGW